MRSLTVAALLWIPLLLACAREPATQLVPTVPDLVPRVLGAPAMRATTVEIRNPTEGRLVVYLSPNSSTRFATVEAHQTVCKPVVRTSETLVLVAIVDGGRRRIYSPPFEANAPGYRWTIKTTMQELATDLWAQPRPCRDYKA